ncbi:DMT family transporter [Xylophilus sp.]|uniref:DMT family transporter n=1 Tax=Xylophilus sp. TaxID=2653893 RepID=UPI002D7F36C5|nr:DMT family transporter [Xylophilus sp.]
MTSASLARLFGLAALWGGSFLFMRVAAPVLGAVPTAFFRVAFAALGLVAIVLAMRVPRDWRGLGRPALALGAINSGIPFLMYALAARVLPAGYSAILNATTPLMGVLIGAALFGERITTARIGGVLVGLAGVAVLMRAEPVAPNAATLLGMGACLVATFSYGLSTQLTRRWVSDRGGLDSRLAALGSQVGAVLTLLPAFAWQAVQAPALLPRLAAAGVSIWTAMLVLGLACTSLGYVIFFRLIADIGPLGALTVTFLVPAFGALWGWCFLGEPLTLAHLGGGGLIAAALWLVLRPAR